MFALRSPFPRSETATVRTNPNANPIPNFNLSLSNPILHVATAKRAFTFMAMFTYRHAVNCSKLIKVKLHGK